MERMDNQVGNTRKGGSYMSKIKPWVDVTCNFCGCIANGSGWYYKGIIGKLKESTKDWIEVNGEYCCPECAKERKEEENDI